MRWFNLLKANTRKEYIEFKRYLPNTLSMFVTFYAIFLAMFFGIQMIGDPGSQDANTQFAIVNYIFWFLALLIMQDIGFEITQESMRGTLEQLCMSPMGMWRILLSRIVAKTIMSIVVVIILLYVSMLTSGQWLNIDVISILPIFILTLISMFGIGFMIAGLCMIVKQIESFLQILQFIIGGLTFVPLSVAPFLAYFPFVKGVDLVRNVMIDGATLGEISLGSYMILIFNAIFYFLLGLFIYRSCERVAMKKGLLGHY